jgi:hypothetical protein
MPDSEIEAFLREIRRNLYQQVFEARLCREFDQTYNRNCL